MTDPLNITAEKTDCTDIVFTETQVGDSSAHGTNGSEDTRTIAYEGLLADRNTMQLNASFQVKIRKEKGFYGPGVHRLLQLTEELGSLSNACHHMGMSYTKGRKLVSTMEKQLGVPVLETQQGGKTGGYSRLTKEAKLMMHCYAAFLEEAETILQEVFQKHFSEFIK